jgi:hypothetical protein
LFQDTGTGPDRTVILELNTAGTAMTHRILLWWQKFFYGFKKSLPERRRHHAGTVRAKSLNLILQNR